MAYDKNTDYMAIMNAAKAKGDMAAYLDAENKREEKLRDMNAAGTNTQGYTSTRTQPVANAVPTNFTGSTKSTTSVSSAAQKIIDQMNANSLKWHTDPNNRAAYEQANQTLAQQLSALKETDENGSLVTYSANHNSASGEWTVTPNYKQATAMDNAGVKAVQPQLEGLALGDKYGINYNQDSIQKLLDAATKAQYGLRNQQQVQSENKFYNNMLDTQGTALDTLRRSQASAVATGASRGMAAANELSAILNLQQVSADESTLLAQNRDNLNVEEAAAYKQNASDSLNTSNSLKQAIANLAATKYGYDTQGYAANLSYLAALADVAAQKYSSDSTLSGVKYNADANVAAAGNTYGTSGKTYGTSGNTYTGGNGGTGTGTPTSTGTPNTDALDLELAANGNTIVPENQSYSITGDGADGYIIKNFKFSDGSTGNLTVDKFEMDKIINNGWNPNAVYESNFGAASYKYNYDTNPNKNMSVDEVVAYYKKYGKYPDGWGLNTQPTYGNPYALPNLTPVYKGTTTANNYSITGTQGQKFAIGQGNYVVTWTYNAKSGVWTDNTGRTKNMNDFKTYLANQSQAYVKALN